MISKQETKEIGYFVLSQKDLAFLRPDQLPELLARSRRYPFDYKKYNPIKIRSVGWHLGTTKTPILISNFLIKAIYNTSVIIFYALHVLSTTEVLIHIEYERQIWDCKFTFRAYNPHLLYL